MTVSVRSETEIFGEETERREQEHFCSAVKFLISF